MGASVSSLSSFGVVPEEMREWKPEMAPHAIVMKQKGKTLPAKIGPVPSTKRVSAGSWISGRMTTIPSASRATVPSFTKVER